MFRPLTIIIKCGYYTILFFPRPNSPQWSRVPHFRGFTITLRHTTLCKTSLDEWSTRRRDLYLTTHNTHVRHRSPDGIRTRNPSKRAVADPHFRPHGQWVQQHNMYIVTITQLYEKPFYIIQENDVSRFVHLSGYINITFKQEFSSRRMRA